MKPRAISPAATIKPFLLLAVWGNGLNGEFIFYFSAIIGSGFNWLPDPTGNL